MKKKSVLKSLASGVVLSSMFAVNAAQAACSDFTHAQLKSAIDAATVAEGSGFNLPMWLTFVDETGTVCNVATSGQSGTAAKSSGDKWLGSRVISAQKANTANAFSLKAVSISTGALYAAVQPGGSLFGLQESNPVNASVAYTGNAAYFGTVYDPLKGKRIGGVNVFGGGLAVYKGERKVGAIGVSGDTSCTDHAVAWLARNYLVMGDTALQAPTPGGFEMLTLADPETPVFAALGDHPACYEDGDLRGNDDYGFAAPL